VRSWRGKLDDVAGLPTARVLAEVQRCHYSTVGNWAQPQLIAVVIAYCPAFPQYHITTYGSGTAKPVMSYCPPHSLRISGHYSAPPLALVLVPPKAAARNSPLPSLPVPCTRHTNSQQQGPKQSWHAAVITIAHSFTDTPQPSVLISPLLSSLSPPPLSLT